MNIYASVMLHNNSFHSWVLLHILLRFILPLYRNPVKRARTGQASLIRVFNCAYIRSPLYIFMHSGSSVPPAA